MMFFSAFALGQREHRLIAQNAPSPEQLQNIPQGEANADVYRYMTPEEISAVDAARVSRLAPLREREAQSRAEDLRQLPEIEQRMQMA